MGPKYNYLYSITVQKRYERNKNHCKSIHVGNLNYETLPLYSYDDKLTIYIKKIVYTI